MKLYYSKGACSLACRIIINELELPCEYIAVDLRTKKTENSEDFLTINPKGYVPVLITADHQLTENSIILQYLAETNNAKKLLPPNNIFQHYQVLEWLHFISTEIHKTCGSLFNPKMPHELKNQFFKPLVQKRFEFIEKNLGEKQFLMAEDFTIADAYLFVMLTWTLGLEIDMSNCPNLRRYFSGLKERESIAKSLKEEGLKL